MTSARWIRLLAAAGIAGAGIGFVAASGTDDPPTKENTPVTKAVSVSLWTVPLMPPLVIGGQEVHTARVKGTLGGRGTVDLDPNPVVVDRFGNTVKMGLRAFKSAEVQIVLLPDATSGVGGGGEGEAGWRLYDLRPVPPTPAWPDGLALRLAVRQGPCGSNRLLVLDAAGTAVRIVTLESAD